VVEDGRVVGLVTLDDLLVTLGQELASVGAAIRHGVARSRRGSRLVRLRTELHRTLDWSLDRAEDLGERAQDALGKELESIRDQLKQRFS
jgi:Mg2+/Co2+ transporter CorB